MFYQTQPVARGGNFSLSRMKPWNYPLHMHRSFELVCATSGELCVTVEHRDYMAAAGEAGEMPNLQRRQSRLRVLPKADKRQRNMRLNWS